MAHRLQLIVAYDGLPFSGWQSQANGNGIQDHLERAFTCITGEKVRVHGAGRTDAGVHALAQSAHVDLTRQKLPPSRMLKALNAVLPPTIRVLRCRTVSSTFHARFAAKGKVYRYRIYRGPVLPPFELGRAWHVPDSLDVDLVKSVSRLFVGTHDFANFAANARGKTEADAKRTLSLVKVRSSGRLLTIELDGDGFLYKMVRIIVGSVVQCGLGKISRKDIADRLIHKEKPPVRLSAPAHGLFLVRVRY